MIGRPTAAKRDYLGAVAARGPGRDEVERALVAFAGRFPEVDEPRLCAWLIGERP